MTWRRRSGALALGLGALCASPAAPAREPARPSPVIHAAEVPALPIAGGKGSARLLLDGRGAPIAFDQLTAEAGSVIPPHQHESSDEIIYVLAGRGVTTIAGRDYAVAPGDVVHIPRGTEHALRVTEALTALQVYAPAGPEQRFKAAPTANKTRP